MFVYGEPITIPADLDAQARERWRLELETRLNALSEHAESNFDSLFSQTS
jgi:hypothetical protein